MSDFVVNNTAPIQMTVDQTTRIIEAISPTLTLTRVAGGLKITVRDKSGTSEAMIYDGTDGTDGQTGPQGVPGPMPVLSIGNIDTGAPGSSVTVTLTGTDANPVLNMSIPRGDKGNTGDTGATGNGIATVVENQDYTLTVTMTDGTTYTSGSIRGEKGETGDTGATGATPQIAIGTVETLDPDVDAYVELDSSSTAEHPKFNFGIPQGIDGDATVDDTAGSGDTAHVWSADKLTTELSTKADVISVTDTTPSSVKTLTDGADGLPMGVTVGIEPVQAGSGDPSPSNVRAISGWDAVKISRTGKNLYDGTVEDGYISDNGTVGTDNSNYHSDYIRVEEGESYTYSLVSNASSSANRRVHGYDANKQWVEMIQKNASSGTGQKQFTFTVPSGVRYIRVQFYQTGAATNKDTNIQIEKGSASSYEQYTGQTYEITIPSTPGTVYGGSLTVNKDGTGKLVVNKSKWTVPRSISDSYLTYSSARGAGVRYTGTTHMKKGSDNSRALCNFTDICMPYNTVYMSTQNWTFFKGSWTSTSEFMEVIEEMYQNETTPEFVWLLDTPVEYTLTASEVNALITSLKGINNLYADSGDVLSVEYSADTKLYVDEHNAEEDTEITSIKGMIADSDDPVATASHAIGDVFICNDQLLRATSVVVEGETISTGTGGNAEVISLADYIAEQVTKIAGLQTDVGFQHIDLTQASNVYGIISFSTLKFVESASQNRSIELNKGTGWAKLDVTTKNHVTRIAFLKSSASALQDGDTPDWCSGFEELIEIPADSTEAVEVPSDCNYILFTKKVSNVSNYDPEKVDVALANSLAEIAFNTTT